MEEKGFAMIQKKKFLSLYVITAAMLLLSAEYLVAAQNATTIPQTSTLTKPKSQKRKKLPKEPQLLTPKDGTTEAQKKSIRATYEKRHSKWEETVAKINEENAKLAEKTATTTDAPLAVQKEQVEQQHDVPTTTPPPAQEEPKPTVVTLQEHKVGGNPESLPPASAPMTVHTEQEPTGVDQASIPPVSDLAPMTVHGADPASSTPAEEPKAATTPVKFSAQPAKDWTEWDKELHAKLTAWKTEVEAEYATLHENAKKAHTEADIKVIRGDLEDTKAKVHKLTDPKKFLKDTDHEKHIEDAEKALNDATKTVIKELHEIVTAKETLINQELATLEAKIQAAVQAP